MEATKNNTAYKVSDEPRNYILPEELVSNGATISVETLKSSKNSEMARVLEEIAYLITKGTTENGENIPIILIGDNLYIPLNQTMAKTLYKNPRLIVAIKDPLTKTSFEVVEFDINKDDIIEAVL